MGMGAPMKSFPLFVNTTDETVVIAGGGEAAAQKARLLSRTDANLVIMAAELNDELATMVTAGRARHVPLVADQTALQVRLVIVASGCAAADAAIADLAKSQGALVNVVDRPFLCDFTMPAIVDRDPVVVAIGTEGTSPVLARQIKSANEALLEPKLGEFASFAGYLRPKVARAISPHNRRAFWEWLVGNIRKKFATEKQASIVSLVNQVLESGIVPSAGLKGIAVIDADCTEADLMSLRAMGRLQTADLVLFGDRVGRDVLDLARRDAKRVEVSRGSDLRNVAAKILEGGNAVILSDGQPPIASLIRDLERCGASLEKLPSATNSRTHLGMRLAS